MGGLCCQNRSIILFDAAYEAFITEPTVPHSIYEIDGAKEVAIEFRSFSKTAGFTGVRYGYTVVPKLVNAFTKNGENVSLNKLWTRRQATKFNGTSYITQRAAEGEGFVRFSAFRNREKITEAMERLLH